MSSDRTYPPARCAAALLGALALAALTGATPARAQFVTPVPQPPSDTAIREGRFRADFYDSLAAAAKTVRAGLMSDDEIGAIRESVCEEERSEEARELCRTTLEADSVRARTLREVPTETVAVLPLRAPLSHDRRALERYLESAAGEDGLALFSRFAANVGDDEAYVTTDIITGLAGRVMFAINYAAVVVKDESGDTEAEQRAIESQKSNVIRMINNGGTVSARLQLPMFALQGPTGQTASSVYSTLGLVGPVGNTDSLKFAGSVVAELVTARTIREFGRNAGILGQVVLGGRIGYAFSEAELLSATRDKGFPFAQLVFGLLQNDKISLSLLYTYPFEDRYRGFAPKLTANFAAIR